MGYKSENIERLRSLTEQIAAEDRCRYCASNTLKEEIIECLAHLESLLTKPKLDKKKAQEDITTLLAKLSKTK